MEKRSVRSENILQKANPVDFGANIVLALSTTSGKRVINKTVGTNQNENIAVHISHSMFPARII